MAMRISDAEWRGDLKERRRHTQALAAGPSRESIRTSPVFEDGPGTNPEETYRRGSRGHVFLDGFYRRRCRRRATQPTSIHTKKLPSISAGRGRFRDLPHYARNRRPSFPASTAATFEQVAQGGQSGRAPVSKASSPPWKISLLAKLR